VNYLTVEEVYLLHRRLIQRTGGSGGLRDPGLLESAVARPQASFDGEDLYPALWLKAAALLHSLVKSHPFVDGNKCTAVTATDLGGDDQRGHIWRLHWVTFCSAGLRS